MKRSFEEMKSGDGCLLRNNGSHVIVSDGGLVEVGGRIWLATSLPDGNLELSYASSSDNAREQVKKCVADMSNEVIQRKEEANNLARQQQNLLKIIENV